MSAAALACLTFANAQTAAPDLSGTSGPVSIRQFNVLPENSAETNKINLQKAIDWAARRGAALYVEPGEEPYPVAGGIVLRQNASLIGAHGPTGRGTRHPDKRQPVGSVFCFLPLYHTYSFVCGILGTLATGEQIILNCYAE